LGAGAGAGAPALGSRLPVVFRPLLVLGILRNF
jgi:hypothetical protein